MHFGQFIDNHVAIFHRWQHDGSVVAALPHGDALVHDDEFEFQMRLL